MQEFGHVGEAGADAKVERRGSEAGCAGHRLVAGRGAPRRQPVVKGAGPHGARSVECNVADANDSFSGELGMCCRGGLDEHQAAVRHQDRGGAVSHDPFNPLICRGTVKPFLEFFAQGVPMGHGAAFCRDVEAPPIGGHRGHVVGRELVKPVGVVHNESTGRRRRSSEYGHAWPG